MSTSTPTAEVTTTIDASSAKVWTALTDPESVKQYFMGATIHTDWQVGSPITWSGEWKGKPYEDKGEVLAFEPGEHLRFSHWSPMGGSSDSPENYHVVDVVLAGSGSRTEVSLRQSNLDGKVTDEDREHRADYEKNWSTVLDGLKKVAER